MNQSIIKHTFKYYQELDHVHQEVHKLRRSNTSNLSHVGEGPGSGGFQDFYEEIEHLIRQENIQQNQVRGNRQTHTS